MTPTTFLYGPSAHPSRAVSTQPQREERGAFSSRLNTAHDGVFRWSAKRQNHCANGSRRRTTLSAPLATGGRTRRTSSMPCCEAGERLARPFLSTDAAQSPCRLCEHPLVLFARAAGFRCRYRPSSRRTPLTKGSEPGTKRPRFPALGFSTEIALTPPPLLHHSSLPYRATTRR